jgi:hypothetical protein
MPTYRYRPDILEALLRHGVRPAAHTPPQQARAFLLALYRFELRRLRRRLLDGRIPKPAYAGHVVRLREQYPLLSLPERFWVVD